MATDTNDNNTQQLFDDGQHAANIRKRLVTLLAPEQDTTSWQEFTELAIKHLPALSGAGRPAAEQIRSSFVGRLGFKSWSAFLTTSQEQGGLGWEESRWKRFKEAYQLTLKHEWLKTAKLSADQVRNLTKVYGEGDDKQPWPTTLDEHIKIEKEKADERKRIIEEAKAKRARQIEELRLMPQLKAQLNTLRGQVADYREVAEKQIKMHGAKDHQIKTLQADLDTQMNAVRTRDEQISLLQADLAALNKRIESLENESTASYLKRAWRALF